MDKLKRMFWIARFTIQRYRLKHGRRPLLELLIGLVMVPWLALTISDLAYDVLVTRYFFNVLKE